MSARLDAGVTFRGERRLIGEWCTRYRINRRTFEYRRAVGWTVEQALTTPVRQQRKLGLRAHARKPA